MLSLKDRKSVLLYLFVALSVLANLILVPLAGYWIYMRGGLSHVDSASLRGHITTSAIAGRREFFHALDAVPRETRPVVMFGDSLIGNGLWPEWYGTAVLNRGIPGETSSEALLRVPDIAALQPTKVFILVGTNDYGRISAEETKLNIRKAVDGLTAASPSTEIYLLSLLPPPTLERESWVIGLNSAYKAIADEQHARWVNLWPQFADGRVIDRKLTTDGIHPSAEGYKVWRQALQPYVVNDADAATGNMAGAR